MTRLQRILAQTCGFDMFFQARTDEEINRHRILFSVPRTHERTHFHYALEQQPLEDALREVPGCHALVTSSIAYLGFVQAATSDCNAHVVDSVETELKTERFMKQFVAEAEIPKGSTVVGIGGGMLCNVASYVAEQTQSDLVLVPTTVLSMCDSSGGKVRLNAVSEGRVYKHHFRSYYEPNAMVLDERFLHTLPAHQVRIGLVEICKHALFQSPVLYEYLIEHAREILPADYATDGSRDVFPLKKATLWAADLKRICLEHDVEEQEYGSRKILRAGHNISDRIEEDSGLTIPHGNAVAIGIMEELAMRGDHENLERATELFDLYKIPKSGRAYAERAR